MTPQTLDPIAEIRRNNGLYADAPLRSEVFKLTASEVHDQHCEGAHVAVIVDNDEDTRYPYGAMMRCPACEIRKNEDIARAAIQASGIGSRYFDTTWDALELVEPLPAIQAAAERITDVLATGHCAIFAGPPGTGKTQAATLLVKAAIQAGRTARLENIGHVAMQVRAGYDGVGPSEDEVTHRMSTADLLIIDDVGAGEAGDGKLELRILYFVLEARQNGRKSTILTSNLTAQKVSDFLGARIVNRLMPLEVFNFAHGKNFRTPTGENAWRSAP